MYNIDSILISKNPEIILRRATSEDMGFIEEVSFKEMEQIVVEAWRGKFNWSKWFEDVAEAITNSYHRVFVIENTGEAIGYLWLNEEPQLVWITAIVIKRGWQRQHIGGYLMKYIIREALGHGKIAIELGVQDNNIAARRFYSKWGFKKFDHLGTASTVLVRLDLRQLTIQELKEDTTDF
ncbi:MAG: GNAT family N-acetyltransferase [Candidatus Heimdallarchaeota archaeon]